MSDRQDLELRLKATDGISPVAAKAGASLDKMGKEAQQAGKVGSTAFRGLKTDAADLGRSLDTVERESTGTQRAIREMGRAADDADRGFDKLDDSTRRSRVGFNDLRGGVSDVANVLYDAAAAAAEEGAIFDRLQASIEATGASYDQYADRIDAAIAKSEDLAFADDAAATALSNLTQTTGDASEALNLLGVAQDLARGKGIDLASAATIVGKVAEGNIGILARYGIAVQEGATAQEALGQLQERYAGQAQAYADSSAGAIDRMTNAFDNQLETLGANTGQLQTLLAVMPGITAGYGITAGAATKATQGIKSLTAETKLASLGATALSAATGPVGLAIAGVTIAAGAAYFAYGKMKEAQDNLTVSAEEVAAGLDGTVAALNQLQQAGLNAEGLAQVRQGLELADQIFANTMTQAPAVETATNNLLAAELDLADLRSQQASASANRRADYNDEIAAQEAVVAGLQAEYDALMAATISESSYAEAKKYTNAILGDMTRTNYPELVQAVLDAQDAFAQTGDADAYIDTLETIAGSVDSYGLSLDDVAPKVDAQTEALRRLNAERIREVNLLATRGRIGFVDLAEDEAGPIDVDAQTARRTKLESDLRLVTDRTTAAIKEQAAAVIANRQAFEGLAVAVGNESVAAMRAYEAQIDAARDAAIAFVGDEGNIIDVLQGIAGATDEANGGLAEGATLMQQLGSALAGVASGAEPVAAGFLDVAEGVMSAQAALDSTIGIVVGGTERLGQSAEAAANYAQGLLDVGGAGGDIAALNSILADNEAVQADILAIQAAQAPYVAEQTAAYADQVDRLSQLNPEAQRYALTLTDAGERAAIATAYSTAYSASLGEIPESVASELIIAEAQANPNRAAILEELGLISVDHEGKITVNFPDGESLTETVGDLTDSIELLARVIAEVNGIDLEIGGIDKTAGGIDRLNSKLGETASVMDRINAWGGVTPPAGPPDDGTGGYVAQGDGTGGNLGANSTTSLRARVAVEVDTGPAYQTIDDLRAYMDTVEGETTNLVVSADGTRAYTVFRDVEGAVIALADGENVVRITGDPADAANDIALINGALNSLNGTTGVIYVEGDPSGATTAANDAAYARDNVDGTSATIYVDGNNSGARNAINGVTGYQGDAYVNVYARRIGGGGIGFDAGGFRDGGVVPMPAIPAARDGIALPMHNLTPVRMNEAGGEIVFQPGGSVVLPAPASRAAMSRTGQFGGGGDVHLHFYGTVNGELDFREVVRQELQAFQMASNRA